MFRYFLILKQWQVMAREKEYATNCHTALTISTTTTTTSLPTTTSTANNCEPFERPPSHATCTSPRWQKRGITLNSSPISVGRMCIDNDDNLFLADSSNHRIVKYIKDSNVPITVASGLYYPSDVFVDPLNNIFIVDRNGIHMWPVDSTKGVTVDDSRNRSFAAIYVNSKAEIYAAEVFANFTGRMIKYSSLNSTSETVIDDTPGYHVAGLVIDQCDNIYVGDRGYDRLLKYPRGINSPEVMPNPGVSDPIDITMDKYGNMYLVDYSGHYVSRWSVKYGGSHIIAGVIHVQGYDDEHLYNPVSAAIDSNGNLYVGDSKKGRIQKFVLESGDLYC
ncbi:unnamed protein product [Didymodactylos carnosus]|uniref:Uncharacterized protein n=2 Tax=Didymodactylos carnosus TaxID=1234261 RepID=A0A813ZBV5_9BILA|nr:unnamed protein product [Didymodactylos carnosus]CAF3679702.1 unnamed protein product [Didymodactylos carnosus]